MNSLKYGSASEAVLLLFALADRLNIYKKEKEMAQQQVLHSLRENERLIRSQNMMLETKVEERTRELKAEKQKSDELLLNILPYETAAELKATGTAEAKYFANVTVMFTDFKDFTSASEKMTAQELVKEINLYYSEFDKIVSRHRLEKIKTIGDSYMCAGGLPIENDTHAVDMVNAALEMQAFMNALNNGAGQRFALRIGISSGPVVAGIVGIKKFAYDIWGDTVNMAARMESSGEAGKVNISASTYALIRDSFTCQHRGKVQAKNKGEVDMYFVQSQSQNVE